jgi:hypothetical protein
VQKSGSECTHTRRAMKEVVLVCSHSRIPYSDTCHSRRQERGMRHFHDCVALSDIQGSKMVWLRKAGLDARSEDERLPCQARLCYERHSFEQGLRAYYLDSNNVLNYCKQSGCVLCRRRHFSRYRDRCHQNCDPSASNTSQDPYPHMVTDVADHARFNRYSTADWSIRAKITRSKRRVLAACNTAKLYRSVVYIAFLP